MISTNLDPEVAEYPDSAKVGIWIGDEGRFFRATDAVEHAGPDSRSGSFGSTGPPPDPATSHSHGTTFG